MRNKLMSRLFLVILAIIAGSAQAINRVDILALYTDEANLTDPAAKISSMVGYMNKALQNSGVDMEIRVVHLQKIDFDGDGKTNSTALRGLRSNAEVATLREEHGADLVAMITAPEYCGIAYLGFGNPDTSQISAYFGNSYAFSVTAAPCLSSFAHELGHNMGLGHSFAQGSDGGVWDWARGHGENGQFVTTMAYTSAYGASRLQYFSTPAVTACKGLPCGKDINFVDGADAAKNLIRLGAQIAAFRAEKPESVDPEDTEDPTAPTQLQADRVEETSIAFSWHASTDDTGVTGYEVYRDGISIAAVDETRYSDVGLDPETTYSYEVVAIDAAGNRSTNSESLVVMTDSPPPPVDSEAPSAPAQLGASDVQETSISLSWLASSDNAGVTGYQLLRDGSLVGSTNQTTYRDANLNPGTEYTYQVLAVDAAGNQSNLSNLLAVTTKQQKVAPPGGEDTQEPTAPTQLQTERVGDTSVTFSWQPSTDDTGVTGYEVYRDGKLVASVGETRYTDVGLMPETIYRFEVVALDAAGNRSTASDVLTIQTAASAPPVDSEAPSSPTELRSTRVKRTIVGLSWLPATDNVGVSGYQILRDGLPVGSTDRTDYRDADLIPGTEYNYQVVALDAAGNRSESSNSLTVTTAQERNSKPRKKNLLKNSEFKSGLDGWNRRNARLGIKAETDGNAWLQVSKRRKRDSAVWTNLKGIVKPGKNYQVSADFKVKGSRDIKAQIYMFLREKVNGRYKGRWILLGKQRLQGGNKWETVNFNFTYDPQGDVRRAKLYLMVSKKQVAFGLDNISLKRLAAR